MKIPTRINKYFIPYMGCKQNIAYSLMITIAQRHPKAKYFWDVFGGGGSMSFMAQQFGLKVFYNEKNEGIYNLLNFLLHNKIPDDWFKFVDRETFEKHKNLNDPYSAMIKVVYSFGNNNKSYLFGKDKEEQKKIIHNLIVYNDKEALDKLNKDYNLNIKLCNSDNLNTRYLFFLKQIRNNKKLHKTQIENLERIQGLERIQNIQNIQLFNLDYKDLKIDTPPEETIIYCDPPYRGTTQYITNLNEGENKTITYYSEKTKRKYTKTETAHFDNEEFDEWFKNLEYTAYLSEYNAPFKKIVSFSKNQLLSATNNSKVVQENLYFNEKNYCG